MAGARRGRSSSEIIAQLNIANAKYLALLVVFLMVVYHGFLKLKIGSDNCNWLLTKGRYQGDGIWQPYGCMIHKYSQADTFKCFQHAANHLSGGANHFALVGDSRMRQLFFEMLKHVDPEAKPSILEPASPDPDDTANNIKAKDARPLEKAHSSLVYTKTKHSLQLSFYWRPVFNESAADLLRQLGKGPNVPSVLVAGSGAWDIKLSNGSEQGLTDYSSNLVHIYRAISAWPNNSSKLLWKPQDPVDGERLSASRRMITNDLIDSYNQVATQILEPSKFRIWQSSRLVSEGMALADDGLHLDRVPLKHHLQILLNMYCNERMNFEDGTCCRSSEHVTTLQLISLTTLLLCLQFSIAALVFRGVRGWRRRRDKPYQHVETELEEEVMVVVADETKSNGHVGNGHIKSELTDAVIPPQKLPPAVPAPPTNSAPNWQMSITSLGKLGLIMAYFFVCDRTDIFMKENKYYSHLNFWLPVGYVFALGLFFNEESRSTKVLHRDQTDEWKGWMQLVILIYHMTGASQVIPLYMQMRFLVSSYLFLTGYGHFCFFWNGGSASFTRLCQVVFRMNLMTVVICLCMNRPYQSYYFVPLVTFWYLIVYAVLALPPKVSEKICDAKPIAYLYITLKFVALFAGITVLYLSEVFFEQIFLIRPWKALFVTQEDELHEWWFRWSLDRYSICFGMVFAFAYLNAQKYGLVDDSTAKNLLSSAKRMVLIVSAAVIGLAGYTAFTLTCRTKPHCNEVHSYIVFIPIVSFVVLRNVFGSVRMRYSSFFAWFGRISLELFIGQYHGWLAADTHGVLVLVPNYPLLNVCVTTFILVCLAHEVHTITGQLVAVAVPSDWKRALRNLFIFLLALVPIAIHDGML